MAQAVVEAFLENPLFRIYAFYTSLLVLKMLLMTILTAFRRMQTMAFANTEDAAIFSIFGGKVRVEEQVERSRRAHLNDLESIPVFFVISFLYIFTNPTVHLATNLFKYFTISRYVHTFVYAVIVVPQPARALVFAIGAFITLYMAIHNVLYFS